jgi:hypothetical protein
MKHSRSFLFAVLLISGCAQYGASPSFLQVGKKYSISWETGGGVPCTILAKDKAGWYFVQHSGSNTLTKRLPDGGHTNVVETYTSKFWLNINQVTSVTEEQ